MLRDAGGFVSIMIEPDPLFGTNGEQDHTQRSVQGDS
jgi:hypothetical protein